MAVYFANTEITGIKDLFPLAAKDITGLYFADTELFTVWAEYDSTLPAQYTANGDYLADYRIYGASGGMGDRTVQLFELLGDMKDADNWALSGVYFMYYRLSSEQLTRLKNVGTIHGKAFEKEEGQYTSGTLLAITNEPLSSDVTTNMRLIQNGGSTTDYSHNFVNDTKAYLCIGYGLGMTEDTKQTFIDAVLDNFDIVLSSTAPAEYVPYGYEVPMSVASNNLIDCESGWQSRLGDGTYTGDNMTGTLTLTARNWFWKVFKVKPNTNYIFNSRCTDYSLAVGYGCYGSNSGVPDTTDVIFSSFAANLPNFEFNSGNRDEIALYLYCGGTSAGTSTYTNLRISEGTGTNFIPYSKTTTQIYIGSDPLGEDEYVDYGEGKVYRMSGGVLTPTDPPVSLPALPTVDGTNIVDYAGQSATVPSRFYAKYRKEGFK